MDLPGARGVNFKATPKTDLRALLPNLPSLDEDVAILDLIERLTVYDPSARLSATDALDHTWFKPGTKPDLILPRGYHSSVSAVTRDGVDLEMMLKSVVDLVMEKL